MKRKGRGSQVWSMEKFENKIIDMRDMYEERKEKGLAMKVPPTVADSDDLNSHLVCLHAVSSRGHQVHPRLPTQTPSNANNQSK